MRIISKFKDYYDGTQSHEDTKTYVRKTRELSAKEDFPKAQMFLPSRSSPDVAGVKKIENGRLFFCGHIYPYLKLRFVIGENHRHEKLTQDFICWSYDEVDALIRQYVKDQKILDRWYETDQKGTYVSWHGKTVYNNNHKGLKLWFEDHDNAYKADAAIELDAPIYYCRWRFELGPRRWETIVNPRLQDLEFYRVLDAWQTGQKLDQYFANNMVKIPEVGTVGGDLIARDRHGFDDYSFKNTAPGQKKEKRRANKRQKRKASDRS